MRAMTLLRPGSWVADETLCYRLAEHHQQSAHSSLSLILILDKPRTRASNRVAPLENRESHHVVFPPVMWE